MICSKCRQENSEDNIFCVYCSQPLREPTGQPTFAFNSQADSISTISAGLSANDLRGRTLDGKYQLEAKLGEGGMGAVYVATRLHIGDKVAVKILRGEESGNAQSLERFRREAQLAAHLKHPNVVAVYDYGVTADGLRYLVMELVEGRNLRQIIVNQGALPLNFIVAVAAQACSALDEAHRQGLVHRDIKPDNIVAQETAGGLRVKILDFGVAKMRELEAKNLTKGGSIVGTPRYMSPEQCMGEEIDGRSDIYSFGIVLYEMLTGNAPFTASSSTGVAVQQVTQPPPPLRQFNNQVSPQVEAVVLRSLEKKREARQQTAMHLAQELNAAAYSPQRQQPASGQFASQPFAAASFPSNSGVSTHEQPTMVTNAAFSGGRMAVPPNFLADSSGAATGKGVSKAVILGAVFGLLGLLLGGISLGVWLFRQSPSESNGNVKTEVSNQSNNKSNNSGATNTNITNTAAASTANEEFSRLRAKRATANPAQYDEIAREFETAAGKYPTDYRFPYERAKLEAISADHKATPFDTLYEAARKAIENNQAELMLNDLAVDGKGDFRRLATGHSQWQTLQDALRRRDKTALQ